MSPRTGRPKSEKPKQNNVKVRFDDELYLKLNEYCEKYQVSKTEVIRQAVTSFLSAKN